METKSSQHVGWAVSFKSCARHSVTSLRNLDNMSTSWSLEPTIGLLASVTCDNALGLSSSLSRVKGDFLPWVFFLLDFLLGSLVVKPGNFD